MEINKNGHARLLDYLFPIGSIPIESIDYITAPSIPLIEDKKDTHNLKGVKIKVDLLGYKNREVCVRRIFTELEAEKKLKIEFYWLNDDGITAKAKKIKIVEFSNSEWEERKRKQRERIMDDLKGRAEKYGKHEYVEILYAHLAKEKLNFVNTGSDVFSKRIQKDLTFDASGLSTEDQEYWAQIKAIYNNSLDGENKVYETLIFLTTL